MYIRPLRYNKPAAQLMLDILNHTNGTAFEPWQLTFSDPESIAQQRGDMINLPHVQDYDLQRPTESTLTRIRVSPTPKSGWTGDQYLTYHRKVIQDHFVAVPFVIYALNTDDETILEALLTQYNLYLDLDMVEITYDQVDINEVLYATHMGSIIENDLDCEDYVPPVTWNVNIKIKDNHPVWMGEIRVYVREAIKLLDRNVKTTLAVRHYLGPGDHDKMPAEMILPMNRFTDQHYLLAGLKVDDLVGPWVVDVARSITDDEWVFTQNPGVFNLYATKVIYNGLNTGEVYINDPKVSNVLVLQFSNEHCRNIAGQWIIGYYNPEAWLKRQRVDAYPTMTR